LRISFFRYVMLHQVDQEELMQFCLVHLTLENEGTRFILSVWDYLHSGAASHHRRPGSLMSLSVCPVKVQSRFIIWGCVNCKRNPISLQFEVLTAVLLKTGAFWVVMLCWVNSSECSDVFYCLHCLGHAVQE